jgi:hypothetical protein
MPTSRGITGSSRNWKAEFAARESTARLCVEKENSMKQVKVKR